MPELPEVEVVRAGLARHIVGACVRDVKVLDARALRQHGDRAQDGKGLNDASDIFVTGLLGRSFGIPERRGKYLWVPLGHDDVLLAHLGMSGQFRVDKQGGPLQSHVRIIVLLEKDSQRFELRFADQRLFGSLSLCRSISGIPEPIRHIALDPFDADFQLNDVAQRMQTRRSTVKRALLDQTLVSGIGNIYADESLWRARTHYDYPTQLLSTRRARTVLRCAQDVMARALAQGGTSFDELYVHVNGESGYFGRELAVYGRAGKTCSRCGHKIIRDAFMNRSSYLCPKCQRLPLKSPSGKRN